MKGRKILLTYIILQSTFSSMYAADVQDSLINLLKSTTVDSARLELMLRIGDQFSRDEAFEEAELYYHRAVDLSVRVKHLKYQVEALDKLGTLGRKQGLYDKSLEFHFNALEIAQDANFRRFEASINNNIGVTYRRRAEDNSALKYHLESLKIAEETDYHKIISYACNSIGIIYAYQDNFNEALIYFNRALELAYEQDNQTGIAINLNSIAWVYELQGESARAIEYYQNSLQVNEQAGNREGMAVCYNDLGKINRMIGNYETSLDYYQKALEINEMEGDILYVTISRINIGQVYADLGNFEKSLHELEIGKDNALQLKSKRLAMEAFDHLSVTYEHLGQFDQALNYHRISTLYRDSIYNEESARQIAEFKTHYDYDKKEQENQVLEAEKKALDEEVKRQQMTVIAVSSMLLVFLGILIYLFIIRRRLIYSRKRIEIQNKLLVENEEVLNEMIATRDKFFKIIAHDLRNHFNVILGYSNLLLDKDNDYNSKERASMLKEVSDLSKNTFQLLENLLVWARSQTDRLVFSPEYISLDMLFEETIKSLTAQARTKGIVISTEIDAEAKVYADQEMINTVLRNLVSNAIKFSDVGGEVTIKSISTEEYTEVSVTDKGVGISKEKQAILFDITQKTTTPGTIEEKGSGLGLILCKEFVEKHGGQLRLESIVGKGSVFSFTIPAR